MSTSLFEKNSAAASAISIPHPPPRGAAAVSSSNVTLTTTLPVASNTAAAAASAATSVTPAADVTTAKSRTARFIPPELRAVARVVCDVDGRQFPELYAGPGRPAPPTRELECITTEIHNGVPLTSSEFRLFRAAYAECRQHLGGVSAAVMASGSRYGEILTLTTRIEALCGDCHIALPRLFPNLKDVHELVLSLSDRSDKHSQQHHEFLDRLLVVLCDLLTRGIAATGTFHELRHERRRTEAATRRAAAAAEHTTATSTSYPSAAVSASPFAFPRACPSAVPSRQLTPPAVLPALGRTEAASPTSSSSTHHALGAGAASSRLSVDVLTATSTTHATAIRTAQVAPLPVMEAPGEDSVDSPHSPKEVSILLSLIQSHSTCPPPRPLTLPVTEEAGCNPSAAALKAAVGSPLDPCDREDHRDVGLTKAKRYAEHANTSYGGEDASDGDDAVDDDEDDDDLYDDDENDSPTEVVDATETAKAQRQQQQQHQRARTARNKRTAQRTFQSHFLLYEDPSFLGPTQAAQQRQSTSETDVLTPLSDGGATTPTDPAHGVSAVTFTAHKGHHPHGRTHSHHKSMASFMQACAAHRSAERRIRYDSCTSQGISPAVAYAALLSTMPLELANEFANVNASLRLHYSHLQWCAEAFRHEEALRFRVGECLSDLSMQKVWASCFGEGCAACSAEAFIQTAAAEAFSLPVRRALTHVVNYNQNGVVSPFSLVRVLRVWGPLLLLDRNVASDLQSGVLELQETYEAIWPTFARRPDAVAGDYLVCLTEEPGEVRLVVLRAARSRRPSLSETRGAGGPAHTTANAEAETDVMTTGRSRLQSWAAQSLPFDISISTRRFTSTRWLQHRGTLVSLGSTVGTGNGLNSQMPVGFIGGGGTGGLAVATSPGARPTGSGGQAREASQRELVTTSYRLSQETGAWCIEGLSRESFETISDACCAFPTILRRAVGHVYVAEGGDVDGTGPATERPPAARTAVLSNGTTGIASSTTHSALHRSCFRNNAAYVRTLIQCGASIIINSPVVDPSISPDFCWTPLLCAVNNPNSDPVKVVELLLRHGADVHYRDDADCTALYYAIANGYTAATAALLRHCPTLGTSSSTCPLTIAVGAHLYHPCERDVRRLAQVLPTREMLEVLCRFANNYSIVNLVANILQDKLNGINREPRFWERHVVAQELQSAATATTLTGGTNRVGGGVGGAADYTAATAELRTPEEQAALTLEVASHTRLCLQHRLELRGAVKVLYERCYWLSWQAWLGELAMRDNSSINCEDGVGLFSTMHSLAATTGRLQRSPLAHRLAATPNASEANLQTGRDAAFLITVDDLNKTGNVADMGESDAEEGGDCDEDDVLTMRLGTTGDETKKGASTANGGPPGLKHGGLLWYRPRDLRHCLEHPASVLPAHSKDPNHADAEDVEETKGGTATAAVVRALAARSGGILRSRKLQQQDERLRQARRSVAEIGSEVVYLEE